MNFTPLLLKNIHCKNEILTDTMSWGDANLNSMTFSTRTKPQKEFEHVQEEVDRILEHLTDLPSEYDRWLNPITILSLHLSSIIATLPLMLAAIEMMARRTCDKRKISCILEALRYKICESRVLKFRFLTLLGNAKFSIFWKLKIKLVSDCYAKSSEEFNESKSDPNFIHDEIYRCLEKENDSKNTFMTTKNTSAQVLLEDINLLIYVSILGLLHPQYGVGLKDRYFRLRKFKDTFRGYEAVDWFVSKIGLQNQDRECAVRLLDRIARIGIIKRLGLRRLPFKDENDLWRSNVKSQPDESGVCFLLESGKKIVFYSKELLSNGITKVEFGIDVDYIDLQSLQFWTRDVFSLKNPKQQDLIGFKLLIHPLGDENGSFFQQNSKSQSKISRLVSDDMFFGHDSDSSTKLRDKFGKDVVFAAQVDKIFTSIARPFILSLKKPAEGMWVNNGWKSVGDRVLVKCGDNLMQDYLCQLIFRLFNSIWKRSSGFFKKDLVPFIATYEVFPIDDEHGFMETIKNVVSLKKFNWAEWIESTIGNDQLIHQMLCSASGAYIGAYILGARDRHWDNILVKDNSILIHIDYGFLFGKVPPVDAPRFALCPGMQKAFQRLGIWDDFLDLCGRAFALLYQNAGKVIRAAELLFPFATFSPYVVRKYINGSLSLNCHVPEHESVRNLHHQIITSAASWKTKLKSLFHDWIDPIFYSLLNCKFPPAVLAIKIINTKRYAKKQPMRSYLPFYDDSEHTIYLE